MHRHHKPTFRVCGAAPELLADVGAPFGGAQDHGALAFGAEFAGVGQEFKDFGVVSGIGAGD